MNKIKQLYRFLRSIIFVIVEGKLRLLLHLNFRKSGHSSDVVSLFDIYTIGISTLFISFTYSTYQRAMEHGNVFSLIIVTFGLMILPLLAGYSDAYKILWAKERDNKYLSSWGAFDFAYQIGFGLLVWYFIHLSAAAFYGAAFWIIHDAVINAVALKKPLGFAGTTKVIDRHLRKIFGQNWTAIFISKFVLTILALLWTILAHM